MKIIHSVREMINYAHTLRSAGKTLALVPTMGALHQGHLSLLQYARQHADYTVMSIFVNPTQFGPNEDFQKYPRSLETDCRLAEAAGCDLLFVPGAGEMYPEGFRTSVSVSGITESLCGASRPNHFSGVTTVVLKLFNIVNAHVAIFGQKDAQQVIVIRRMVADLHHATRIIVAPTVREKDGLAISSRNVYLTLAERPAASLIYQGLCAMRDCFSDGERTSGVLQKVFHDHAAKSDLVVVEYCAIVDPSSLELLSETGDSALAAVACRMRESTTRLIDNIHLGAVL